MAPTSSPPIIFALALKSLDTDLLVTLLKDSQVLAGLGDLTL